MEGRISEVPLRELQFSDISKYFITSRNINLSH